MIPRASKITPGRFIATLSLCIGAVSSTMDHRARAAEAPPQWTLIHAGTLLAVPGSPALRQASIVIKNDRIVEIRSGYITPAELKDAPADRVALIELRDKFVLPGLIDSHVHGGGGAGVRSSVEIPAGAGGRLSLTAAQQAINGTATIRRTLLAGFTTIRDVGSDPETIFALRDGVRFGLIAGPRILAAGAPLSPTGGHSDPLNGYRQQVAVIDAGAVCDGAESCEHQARRQIKLGADLIKVMATGGIIDDSRGGVEQQFTDDELHAIVETAHLFGRKVAAHAEGARGIKSAIRAGVDSVEHGIFLDDEAVKLMKERGTYLVPTLLGFVIEHDRAETAGALLPSVHQKEEEVWPAIGKAVQLAYKSGVKMAFGTDIPPGGGRPPGEEFALLVKYGVRPADAIRFATVNAADLLGISADTGTIEAGKSADVVATDASPLEDITQLTRITFVMKSGHVYKGPGGPSGNENHL
jgi:imidazolonepropionase-like amidohydrolase